MILPMLTRLSLFQAARLPLTNPKGIMSKENDDPQPPQAPLPDDVLDGLRSLIEGKADGDKENALRLLYNDNKNLRDANRQLKDSQPPEGAVVLEGDEADRYREIQADEDKDPIESLSARLSENEDASKRLQELERKETLRTVAEAEGITNLDAFAGIANGEAFEVKTEEDEDGNDVQRAYVAADEDAESVPLKEYERFQPYHASLFGEAQEKEDSRPSMPEQQPGGNPPSNEKTDDELKNEQRKQHRFSI